MKIRLVLFIAIFTLLSNARATERAALIIGNDIYPGAPLDNAVNDATAFRNLLRDHLEFPESGLVFGTDLKRLEIFEKIETFKKVAADAEIVLIYYAGHGMESLDGKENFLLPVDADVLGVSESEAALRAAGINILSITGEVAKVSNGAKVLLMDCCRQRPAGRGINREGGGLITYSDDQIPADTLMILAAAPERVASDGKNHGPFTQALLELLPRPEQNLLDTFFAVSDRVQEITNKSQIPWMRFDGSGKIFRERSFLKPGARVKETGLPVTPVMPTKGKEPARKLTEADLEIPHDWVNRDGKEIHAMFLGKKGSEFDTVIVLKTADGRLGEVRLSDLSPESRDLAMTLLELKPETVNAFPADQKMTPGNSARKPGQGETVLTTSNLVNTKWSTNEQDRYQYFLPNQRIQSSWGHENGNTWRMIDDHTIQYDWTLGSLNGTTTMIFNSDFTSYTGGANKEGKGSMRGELLGPIGPGDKIRE